MSKEKYLKLGELLIKEGMITQADLEKAISTQRQEGGRLGEIIVKLGVVKEEDIVRVLGKQLGIPYFTIGTGMLRPAAGQKLENFIPHEYAMKNYVLPLSHTLKSITVAMSDPLDLLLLDNLRKLTGCEINPVIATKAEILNAIEEFYGRSSMLKDAVMASYEGDQGRALETADMIESELSLDKLIARAEEAPVVKLVDLIIRQAINERASDIHIEPFKDKISLRYRIDGKLYEIPPPAKHLHLAIISRIKILAKLDIAEKRLPQDGAIMVKIDDRPIDLRVSTIPTIYGEKTVLRILDRSSVVLDLSQLGFEPKQLELMRKAMSASYGLMFLTGPTGSGKTTTLYAMLSEMKDSTKNIITIEDPVEYKLEGINQVQVKPEIGLSFANALRSFLRQDPDIMLVGEMRDLETVDIAIKAALTGHLVFSTIHTNDAASSITRMVNMNVEPFLIADSLILIAAQRLVRRLCQKCKVPHKLPEKAMLDIGFLPEEVKTAQAWKAGGCDHCNNTGYKGRIALYEVLPVDDDMREQILMRAQSREIKKKATEKGMITLRRSGLIKIKNGITSIEEVLRESVKD